MVATDSNDASGSEGESFGDTLLRELPTAAKRSRRRNRKQEQSWLKQQCLDLVRAVEPMRCLWDNTQKHYRDRLERLSSWQTIAQRIGRTENDCKNKWFCMRTNYKTTVAKLMQTKCGRDAIASNDLQDPYSAMRFLDTVWKSEQKPHAKKKVSDAKPPIAFLEQVVDIKPQKAGSKVRSTENSTLADASLDPLYDSSMPFQSQSSRASAAQSENDNSCCKRANNAYGIRPAMARTIDSWDSLGDFVASNARDWHQEFPLLAAEFHKEIVSKIFDFSGKVLEAKQKKAINNETNSFKL